MYIYSVGKYCWFIVYPFIITVLIANMDEGFQKGDTHNLPNVDVIMVSDFLATNTDFNQPQSSGVKASR